MKRIFKNTFVVILCFLMLLPFVFVIIGATNNTSWAFSSKLDLSIGKYFVENFKSVEQSGIFAALFNSLATSLLTAIISTIVMTLCAYAFSKYQFKGKNIIISTIAVLAILPQPTYLIGQLKVINNLGLYSTFGGLIIPFLVNVKLLFYLVTSCKNIPNDAMNAARIDGASEFRVMTKVSLPIIFDKILLAFFLIFVASWNNFLIPMIITNSSELFTLPVLISSIADPMRYDIGAVFMALLFSIVPITIMFALFQKKIFIQDD